MCLNEFRNSLIAKDQIEVNRKTDACNWYLEERNLFHNRTYWGRSRRRAGMNNPSALRVPAVIFQGIFTQPSDSYWAGLYTDKKLAEADAKKYNAEVEGEFYCDEDNPSWFLIFSDFDEVTRYVYETEIKPNLKS